MGIQPQQYFEVELSNVKLERKWIFFHPMTHQVFSLTCLAFRQKRDRQTAMNWTKLRAEVNPVSPQAKTSAALQGPLVALI